MAKISLVKRTIFNIGMHDGKFYDKNDLEINPIYSELKLLHYKNIAVIYLCKTNVLSICTVKANEYIRKFA